MEPLTTTSLIGSGCCHSVRRETKVMSSTPALPPLQVMHFLHLLHIKSMHFPRSLPFISCISSTTSTSGHMFPTRVQDNSQKETEASHMEQCHWRDSYFCIAVRWQPSPTHPLLWLAFFYNSGLLNTKLVQLHSPLVLLYLNGSKPYQ